MTKVRLYKKTGFFNEALIEMESLERDLDQKLHEDDF